MKTIESSRARMRLLQPPPHPCPAISTTYRRAKCSSPLDWAPQGEPSDKVFLQLISNLSHMRLTHKRQMVTRNVVNRNPLSSSQLPSQRLVVSVLRVSSFNSEKNNLHRSRPRLVRPGHRFEHGYIVAHLPWHRTIYNSKHSLSNRPQTQAHILPDEKECACNCNIDPAVRQPAIISFYAINYSRSPELKPIRGRKMPVISGISSIQHNQNRYLFSLSDKLSRHLKCHKPTKRISTQSIRPVRLNAAYFAVIGGGEFLYRH